MAGSVLIRNHGNQNNSGLSREHGNRTPRDDDRKSNHCFFRILRRARVWHLKLRGAKNPLAPFDFYVTICTDPVETWMTRPCADDCPWNVTFLPPSAPPCIMLSWWARMSLEEYTTYSSTIVFQRVRQYSTGYFLNSIYMDISYIL